MQDNISRKAIDDLNCHNYLNDYKECIIKNQKKGNYKQCVEIMDNFRYCLVNYENERSQKQSSTQT